MSDWAVGDLAVCVDESPDADGLAVPLAEGRTYSVCEVIAMAPANAKWQAGDGLNLSGIPAEIWGYAAERFRKVVSDKHEACETEFVTLLKRSKVPALLEDEGSCQEVTKQIREWREEDRRAGIIWSDEHGN